MATPGGRSGSWKNWRPFRPTCESASTLSMRSHGWKNLEEPNGRFDAARRRGRVRPASRRLLALRAVRHAYLRGGPHEHRGSADHGGSLLLAHEIHRGSDRSAAIGHGGLEELLACGRQVKKDMSAVIIGSLPLQQPGSDQPVTHARRVRHVHSQVIGYGSDVATAFV